MINLLTWHAGYARLIGVDLVRGVAAALCLAVSALLGAAPAAASSLLAPAVGAADSATAGTRVADPHTPSAALFANPAGLTGFETFTHGGGFGIAYGRARIEASMPAGFSESHSVWTVIPDFGVSIPYDNRWRFALGSYGSTGSKFDFGPDPASGVPSFFSEMAMAAFPLGIGYRLSDRFSVGGEVAPLFGQLRTHFPLGGLDFRYKINGPGVQGMLGATLRLNEEWAFGVGARTPGMVWMTGSMALPGGVRQGVHSDLEMPAQIFLGATWRGLPRLVLSSSVRFTDSSSLGDSPIEYDLTPQANSGFVPDSHDEWKFALAGEYAMQEQTKLRLSASWAPHIVGSNGVNPLVFDADDTKINAGVGREFGRWTIDLTAGFALPGERHIPPSEALVFPGGYSMEGAVIFLGLMRR